MTTTAPRRSRLTLAGGAAAAIALVWWGTGGDDPRAPTAAAPGAQPTAGATSGGWAPIRRLADGRWGASTFAPRGPDQPADGLVRVRGTVIGVHDNQPVGNVEVVFSGTDGEAETTAADDGTYSIDVPAGAYRAFVRGDGVMSVSAFSMERLPGPPALDAGLSIDELAPMITIVRDERGVDLPVELGGVVSGRVVDRAGHPIAHALVRARGEMRPVLGTDVAETDASGQYRLELPTGNWVVDAAHPDFGGLDSGQAQLDLLPGTRATTLDLTLVAGCIIRGRVLGADGTLTGDGAIEGRVAREGEDFGPIGRIEPDGTFRFQTTVEASIELRAWPWKSPPSPGQTFRCSEGARFAADFRLDRSSPDLDGTIATADGRPAAGAFLDVMALSDDGQSQQERADADGTWAVFAMPAGDYVVTATVPGEGAVSKHIHVPAHGVALALGGTGNIAGTVKGVPDGALAMTLGGCEGGPGAAESRLVPVHDGRFRIDGVPACTMFVAASAGGRGVGDEVHVAAGADATVTLDLSPPRKVTVRGRVTTADGHAAIGAVVRASDDSGVTSVTTDGSGAYQITVEVGGEVTARIGDDEAAGFVPDQAPDLLTLDLRLRPNGDEADEIDDAPSIPEPAQPGDDADDLPPDRNGVKID